MRGGRCEPSERVPAFENKYEAAAVTCPICHKPASAEPVNPWRPFCSERCKLADLGQWFAGRYAIPADREPEAGEPPEPPARQ